ncbi:MAG: flagellar motor protein MotB [Thiohalomonadales bacterium]
MANDQAIIVKKIVKAAHGHHGGAWKVAFADFVTAMMAFFLLLWLMGSTTEGEKKAISDYFENPSAVQGPGGASTSMIKLGGEGQEVKSGKSDQDRNFEDSNPSSSDSEITEQDKKKDAKRLEALKLDLEKAISDSKALNLFKDQLLLDITAEGLRIQIVDKKNRPMFSSGSSSLKPYTLEILKEIAVLIAKVPNKISLTGHTDATPFRSFNGDTNWELSADRANASRRALVMGGVPASKVAKVVGLASTVLFDKKNPNNSINRRISLIVMNKASEDLILKNASALAGRVNSNTENHLGGSAEKRSSGTLKINKPHLNTLGAPRTLSTATPKPTQKPTLSTKSASVPKLQTF